MAVQAVKVENDSGSNARVAFDLMKYIAENAPDGVPRSKVEILNLYADCLDATWGNRQK